MKNGFAPIVVLLTIAVIVAGFLVLQKGIKNQNQVQPPQASPSPDPYPGWKTYKNSTYSFTIRYPKKWFIKQYGDYAANFLDQDPKEATPGAIKVRYSALTEKTDTSEFEKIYKTDPSVNIREPLDVKSIITKVKNLEIGKLPAVDYTINRNFSALEGPKTEYSHVYEIKKDNAVLKFIASDETRDLEQKVDPTFQQMINSLLI